MARFTIASTVLAAVLGLAMAALVAAPSYARTTDPTTEVALADLPRAARDTHALIRRGGPFPFERDGVVFVNRERLLPERARGYYHEYTVKTPGAQNRGSRRIICGGPKTAPDVCWYTSDHYKSFRKILE